MGSLDSICPHILAPTENAGDRKDPAAPHARSYPVSTTDTAKAGASLPAIYHA